MPRRSAASLSVVAPAAITQRPKPPASLTPAESEEWTCIVNRMPADWFKRETHALLVAMLKHWSAHRVLCDAVDAFKPEWMASDEGLARYDKLLAMRSREGRDMAALATKLRLTMQSRYDPAKAERQTRGPTIDGGAPWTTIP